MHPLDVECIIICSEFSAVNLEIILLLLKGLMFNNW